MYICLYICAFLYIYIEICIYIYNIYIYIHMVAKADNSVSRQRAVRPKQPSFQQCLFWLKPGLSAIEDSAQGGAFEMAAGCFYKLGVHSLGVLHIIAHYFDGKAPDSASRAW